MKLIAKGFMPKIIPKLATADSMTIAARAALRENLSSSTFTPVSRTGSSAG